MSFHPPDDATSFTGLASVSGAGNWTAISGVTLVYNGTGIAALSGRIIISFKNNVFYGNKKNGPPTSFLTLK